MTADSYSQKEERKGNKIDMLLVSQPLRRLGPSSKAEDSKIKTIIPKFKG